MQHRRWILTTLAAALIVAVTSTFSDIGDVGAHAVGGTQPRGANHTRTIDYYFQSTVNTANRQSFRDAAAQWNWWFGYNLLVEVSTQPINDHAWIDVVGTGTECKGTVSNTWDRKLTVWLPSNCSSIVVARHEMSHALGFRHETAACAVYAVCPGTNYPHHPEQSPCPSVSSPDMMNEGFIDLNGDTNIDFGEPPCDNGNEDISLDDAGALNPWSNASGMVAPTNLSPRMVGNATMTLTLKDTNTKEARYRMVLWNITDQQWETTAYCEGRSGVNVTVDCGLDKYQGQNVGYLQCEFPDQYTVFVFPQTFTGTEPSGVWNAVNRQCA